MPAPFSHPPARARRSARRVSWLVAAALGAVLAAAACSPLAVINRLVPDDTHTVTRELAYGEHPRQRLDLYAPLAAGAAAARGVPVVVFFYGGAWTAGARADYRFAGEAFASRGYLAVVADYRLHPEVRFPEFLHDAAAAVAWAARNAARYGGDPARLYLAGHSAGAYNAAMLAYAPRYLADAGVNPDAIRGFIGLAGPYDFLPLTGATTRAVFGYPDTAPTTQPIHFIGREPQRRLPPALLVTATTDGTVSPGNSARLAARLRAAGAPAVLRSYDNLDHARVVGALAAPLRGMAPVLDDIAAFIAAQP
ncbi:MAG: alpha/beta hydrolase [Burkholderiales bacterium]|nr:alpha/beta hydrolase [Burkholderiales bacterium]